jgi:DNA-binding transcriptional MerR regulator
MSTLETSDKPLTIGAVCRAVGDEFPDISISKIRYLEDQELLRPRRTPGGYRLYAQSDVERLRTILRLQRDEFLPLRVIRQELAGGGDRERRPGRRRIATIEDRRRLDRSALLAETGAADDFLRELEDFGLVTRGGLDGSYGTVEAEIVAICMRMAGFGLGPRHLRQFHSAIRRATGLIEGVVAPSLRSRNPDRRDAGLDDLAALAHLSAELTERILVRDVHGSAGS